MERVFVCLKQVPATETKIKIIPDGSSIDEKEIKWITSPYDEFAMEEALRIKEKNAGLKIIVVSVGPKRVEDTLRVGLALGADEAIRVDLPANIDAAVTAKALSKVIQQYPSFDLVLTGKEAIDTGGSEVGQRLSVLLGIPSLSVIFKIEYFPDKVRCQREQEGGSYGVIEAPYPLLITTQKGLNQVRLPSIPNVLQAKKKEIKVLTPESLGINLNNDLKMRFHSFVLPNAKPPLKKCEGTPENQVKELVKLLREEAKAL